MKKLKEKDALTCRLLKRRLLDKAHTRKPREVW